jgi:hypothetical protein
MSSRDSSAFDTEDIAIEAGSIFPGMFSWVKYPEMLDKNLVRLALTDARRMHKWVLGTHKEGWILTDTGRGVGEAVLDSKTKPQFASKRNEASSVETIRFRHRLLSSEVHSKVLNGHSEFNRDEIYSFFRINPYMSSHDVARRVNRMKRDFSEDSELGESVSVAIAVLKSMIGEDIA